MSSKPGIKCRESHALLVASIYGRGSPLPTFHLLSLGHGAHLGVSEQQRPGVPVLRLPAVGFHDGADALGDGAEI